MPLNMRASQQCLFRCCEKLPRRFVPLVHYSYLVPSATHSANQITPMCKPVLCVLLLHYYHAQMYPFWKIFRAYSNDTARTIEEHHWWTYICSSFRAFAFWLEKVNKCPSQVPPKGAIVTRGLSGSPQGMIHKKLVHSQTRLRT